ncbi:MAG TPA: hypothetical protein VK978_04460 [Candidatus Saccharimonadales bacterium]|nr:hypothetical protein [Candidatus Saccharimonadales bacterium]
MSILPNFKQKKLARRAEMYRALIHHEAKIGGELFGVVPEGSRREFFCLDKHTWVWHEEWIDDRGNRQFMMTRYDVRPGGVVKSQGNNAYQALTKEEFKNFYRAVKMYHDRIRGEYSRLLQTV